MAEEKTQETKKKKKWPWIAGGVVLLIITVAIISNNDTTTQNTNKNNEAKNTQSKEEAKVPLQVDAASFVTEFDKNQLQAEEKYKNKFIKFTAVIGNISEDIGGTAFLSLNPSADQYYIGTTIKCSFKNKSDLTALSNGQSVTLQGTVDTQSFGIIDIKDCKVVK
jgi:hypothetical protein